MRLQNRARALIHLEELREGHGAEPFGVEGAVGCECQGVGTPAAGGRRASIEACADEHSDKGPGAGRRVDRDETRPGAGAAEHPVQRAGQRVEPDGADAVAQAAAAHQRGQARGRVYREDAARIVAALGRGAPEDFGAGHPRAEHEVARQQKGDRECPRGESDWSWNAWSFHSGSLLLQRIAAGFEERMDNPIAPPRRVVN